MTRRVIGALCVGALATWWAACTPPTSTTPDAAAPSTVTKSDPTPDATDGQGRPTAGQGLDYRYPAATEVGVPEGWQPRRTLRRTLRITRAGSTVRDVRLIGANLEIAAPDVRVERVEIDGGVITNEVDGICHTGLVIDRSTVRGGGDDAGFPAIGTGGYTARRTEILDAPEGFRVGGRSIGCGPVLIVDSRARILAPDPCGDWHGDGIQGYDGAHLDVRRTVLELVERDDCGGTAAFFYPADQGNTSVDIRGLVVRGGGYPFRLGTAGDVDGLSFVAGSWGFAPAQVDCRALDTWTAAVVDLDDDGQPVTLRPRRCPDSD